MRCVFRVPVAIFMAIILLLLSPAAVLAADVRTSETVTVPAGEVVNGDLYAAGSSITIDGTVNGDVFAAGQSITINGQVNGGITLAAQIINVNGNVTGGARLAAQSIMVSGSIGRDLMAAGATLTVSSRGSIGTDLYIGASSAQIDGRVGRDVRGNIDTLTLTDGVGRNVDITVTNLTIASTANISGDVTYQSNNEARIASGAKIGGTVRREAPVQRPGFQPIAAGLVGIVIGKILGDLMIFLIGLVRILLFAPFIGALTVSLRTAPWECLGWGALILFATPIAIILLLITVIGIPLGLIVAMLYAIAIYLAQIPVALVIGWLILRPGSPLASRGFMIGAFALGQLLLLLIRLVPFVSWLFTLFIVLFGLGTLVTAIRKGYPKQA